MKNKLLAISILFSSMAVHAATLYVDLNSGSPISPFNSGATAATNIQTAVDASLTGDTVLVADGHYILSEAITVTSSITIKSVNGPESTWVDGAGGSFRIFQDYTPYGSTFSGLTITGSEYGGDGCGLFGGSSTATNCTFSNNRGYRGGGMNGGTAIDCTFSNNYAYMSGGGLYSGTAIDCLFVDNESDNFAAGLSGMARNCTFSNNVAGEVGGAMYGSARNCLFVGNFSSGGAGALHCITAYDCIFSNNTANGKGGAVYGGSVSNCVFVGNHTAKDGGGTSHTKSIIDCVFISNTASGNGGGIYLSEYEYVNNGGFILESCTFTSNSAATGGGIFATVADNLINNCVFSHNTAHSTAGGGLYGGIANNCTFTENMASVNAGGGMAFGTANNCISWNNIGDNFAAITTNSCWVADPLFVDAANGDFHLLETSPCIDTGSNTLASALSRDRDGNDRIQGGTVDYGAYEFVPPILTTNTLAVISAYGSPLPPVGSADYPHGTMITCSVDSVTSGLTNYSAIGWSLSEQEPASGTTNWFELTSTTNATLTWNWQTNYWLEVSVSGNGSVDVPDDFYVKNSEQILMATPDAGWLFMGWSGDASGTNEAFVMMTEPQTVMANFSDDADGDGLTNSEEDALGSNPWNSDTDGDGFGDKLEVDHNWNPVVSDQWAVDYINANGDDFGLYPSNIVLDVAVGQILIETAGGNATLSLQLEESDDLVTWTNAGPPKVWSWPVDDEKKFFRVRSGQ